MALTALGLPPQLTAPGLAPQLNLNGGQQGQGLILAAGGGGGLGLNQTPEAQSSPLSETYINFAKKWAAIYHGKATPESIHPRLLAHQRGERRPKKDALGNMEAAVEVFKGDLIKAPGIEEGAEEWTAEEIKQILTRIGAVETGFDPEQKKQRGGGPARSYWQVEPETALSLLRDSKGLFGPKFEERFSKYKKGGKSARESLASLEIFQGDSGAREISKILLDDGDLAATLAMAKWVAGLQNQVKQ